MRRDIQELQELLKESDMACVREGVRSTKEDFYPAVKEAYPDLCDDSHRCSDVCSEGNNGPEWYHAIRRIQQQLSRRNDSRVNKHPDHGVWKIEPLFEMGKEYDRRKLHDRFGGARYRGIAPSGDHPIVFLITGDSGEEHGYKDEFHGDTFIYSGEGREGDMEWSYGNEAIRKHKKSNIQLHLFEDTDEAWKITYIGEFEYSDHFIEELPDTHGSLRDAIRFKLSPVDPEVEAGERVDLNNSDPQNLYQRAKSAKQTGQANTKTTTTTSRTSFSRSEIVREFALSHADGVCQGCGKEAPFLDLSGEPFLEVHHLYRRSDGGPDNPENVIALCPNCHRRVHQGRKGEEFNDSLIQKAKKRNQDMNNS